MEKKTLSLLIKETLNLSDKEAKAYIMLLLMGQLTDSEISVYSEIDYSEINAVLKKLQDSGLIREIAGIVPRFHANPPYKPLLAYLEDFGKLLEDTRTDIINTVKKSTVNLKNQISKWKEKINSEVEKETEKIRGIISSLSQDSNNLVAGEVANIKADISQTVEETVNENNAAITKIICEILKQLDESVSKSKVEIEKQKTKIVELLNDNRDTVTAQSEVIKTETIKSLSSFNQGFKDLAKDTQSIIKESLEKYSDYQQNSLNEMKDAAIKTNKNLSESVANLIDEANTKINSLINAFETETSHQLSSLKEALTTSITESGASLKQSMDNIKEGLKLSAHSIAGKNNSLIEELQKNIATIIESLQRDNTNLISNLSEEIKNKISDLEAVLNDKQEDLNNLIVKTSDSLMEGINKVTDNIQESLNSNTSTLYQLIEEEIPAEKEALEKDLANILERQQENISEVNGAVQEVFTNLVEQINNLKNKLQEVLSSTQNNFSGYLGASKDKLSNTIELLSSKMNGNLKLFEDNFKSQLESYRTSTVSMVDEFKEAGSASLKKLLISMANKLRSAEKNMAASISASGKESSDQINEAKTSVADKIGASIEETGNILSELESQVVLKAEENQKTLNENIEAIKGNLDKTMDTRLETLEKNSSSQINDIKAAVEEMKSEVEEACNQNTENISKITDQLIDSHMENIKKAESSVRESFAESLQALAKSESEAASIVVEAATTIVSKAEENHEKGCSLTEKTFAKAMAAIENEVSSTKDQINNLNNKMSESLSTLTSEVKTKADSDLAKLTTNLLQKYTVTVNNLQNVVVDYTNLNGQKLIENLDSATAGVEKITSEVADKSVNQLSSINSSAKEAETVLKTAWEEVAETVLGKAEDSWHMVSKIAVITHISDMIIRTKSTITIVLPELEENIINTLLTVKPKIRVHLIAGLDMEADIEKIKKLLQKGNIRVWERTERDFLGCARDNEEVLLAPSTDESQKIVAIISQQPGYVDLVHRVFGPMWMASSKEVREKDLL